MSYLCIKPVCGPDCCGCSRAISPDDERRNAIRYELLKRMDPRFGMPTAWLRFETLDQAIDSEIERLDRAYGKQCAEAASSTTAGERDHG